MDAQPEYPAAYSSTMGGVISVGASDSQDAVPSFSNYGATTVQLFAPGVAILSTVPGASYQSWSGTRWGREAGTAGLGCVGCMHAIDHRSLWCR